MNIAVLYRKPSDADEGFSSDSDGRGDIKHIIRIKEALQGLGHRCCLVDVNLDSYEYLRNSDFDLAFNLCDDGFRNNSLLEAHIPAILDILQISYTGANFFTLATCVDKARTKEILSFHGIDTPEFQVFCKSDEKLDGNVAFPAIVKPLHEDASIGLRPESVVNNPIQLRQRVEIVLKDYHQPALVERFIQGREIYVGILGSEENLTILPLSEIIFENLSADKVKICSYDAKWVQDSREYKNTPVECPAKLDKSLEQKLIAAAKKAYSLLDCQDYGRIDFRIDKNNRPYVLEVNPNPDLSWNAGLARMAKASGMNYNELIGKILQYALERKGMKKVESRKNNESSLSLQFKEN